jgi:hypothetical protein
MGGCSRFRIRSFVIKDSLSFVDWCSTSCSRIGPDQPGQASKRYSSGVVTVDNLLAPTCGQRDPGRGNRVQVQVN